jgi:hypothetical protein
MSPITEATISRKGVQDSRARHAEPSAAPSAIAGASVGSARTRNRV